MQKRKPVDPLTRIRKDIAVLEVQISSFEGRLALVNNMITYLMRSKTYIPAAEGEHARNVLEWAKQQLRALGTDWDDAR